MGLLPDDIRLTTDGGGRMPSALNVIEGADRTARFAPGGVWRRDLGVDPRGLNTWRSSRVRHA